MLARYPTDRDRTHRAIPDPPSVAVDAGEEAAYLERRTGTRAGASRNTRPTEGKSQWQQPPRRLIDELQASIPKEEQSKYSSIKYEGYGLDQEITDQRLAERVAANEQRRSTRATRGTHTFKSPPPIGLVDSVPRVKHDNGPAWEEPVVYPFSGRKRTTVEFTDLERLDDDEFLNDNLIAFYIRFLMEREKNKLDKVVYFFPTHFYTALTTTAEGKRGLNYQAVERWTRGEDIFQYDFVVVPINEK